jgi:hypothetical protein
MIYMAIFLWSGSNINAQTFIAGEINMAEPIANIKGIFYEFLNSHGSFAILFYNIIHTGIGIKSLTENINYKSFILINAVHWPAYSRNENCYF